MNVDVLKMRADKFDAAGLPFISVNVDGSIVWAVEPSAEQLAKAAEIIVSIPDDYKTPEYIEKRQIKYAERSIGDQLDAIYHFAKDFAKYLAAGKITPDPNAEIGTPEEWIAWQDAIRQQIPKTEKEKE